MGYLQGYLIAIYLFAGYVSATHNDEQYGAWNRNKEYRYNLKTQTMTAIPDLKNQWAGVVMRGKLTIRPQSNDVLVGKLHAVDYANVHDELMHGWDEDIPEEKLTYRTTEMTDKPFEVRLRNGIIHSIAVDKTMTNNDLNQLKAALSQLQVDIRAENAIKSRHNQFLEDGDSKQAMYKVMEPTVTGKCETLYDISPLSEHLIEMHREWEPLTEKLAKGMHYRIVKTKNYDNCKQRLGYHFGVSGINGLKMDADRMDDTVTKTAVSNVIVVGKWDRYTIESSVTINKVIAKPNHHDEKKATVVSAVYLTLEDVQESLERPKLKLDALTDVGNLVYTYDLPSDKTNGIRPMDDSSEEERDEDEDMMYENEIRSQRKYSDESEDDEKVLGSRPRRSAHLIDDEERKGEDREDFGVKKELKKLDRKQRKSHRHTSESRLDYDSKDFRRQFYQPKPTLKDAPELPLSPMFIGYRGQSIHHAKNINVMEMTKKLAEEIGYDLLKPNEIPTLSPLAKFNTLSAVIRTMSAEQIERLTEELYVDEPEVDEYVSDEDIKKDNSEEKKSYYQRMNARTLAWKAFRDAVTDAGTGPAITVTMKWIQQRKVRGEAAAQLIAAWPKTIREPTEEMQIAFYEFATNDKIQKLHNVNTTVLIALTRFLRMTHVSKHTARINYPVDTFGRLTDHKATEKVIEFLEEKLTKAIERRDASNVLVYVRALGQLGHPDVLRVFEPYLEGKKVATDFQRLAMVVALEQLRMLHPKTTRPVLFKIYKNTEERHELRVAAVFQLIAAEPDAIMLQRMAEQTNIERDLHVRAAVISAIESVARMEAREYSEFIDAARAAAKLLPKERLSMQYSRTDLRDYVSKELNTAYLQKVSWIFGKDSLIPSAWFARSHQKLGGFRFDYEHHAMVSSIDRLTEVLTDHWKVTEKKDSRKKSTSTPTLAKLLNIQTDEAEKLEGELLMSVLNGKRLFTFDKFTLDKLPREMRKLAATLKKGHKFDYTKLYNSEATTIAFPLETGLPFVYAKHVPTLIRANGKIRARVTPDMTVDESMEDIEMPRALNVTADIELVYSTAPDASIGFVHPRNHKRFEAGYTQKAQIYLPVRFSVNIDLKNRKIETEIRPRELTKRALVFHVSTWPYTGHHDILALRPIEASKDKKLILTRPQKPFDYTFGDRIDYHKFEKTLRRFIGEDSRIAFNPNQYEVNVNFEPERTKVDTVKFTFAYDSESTEGKDSQAKWKKHPRALNVNDRKNLAIPTLLAEKEGYERRREYLTNAAIDIVNTDAQVVEIVMEVRGKGEKKAEYVATVAKASSLTDEKSRILAFVSAKLEKEHAKLMSIPQSFQMCVQADGKHNESPRMNFNDALNYPTESNVDWRVTYGEKCDSAEAKELRAYAKLRQTEALKEFLRSEPAVKVCLEQMQKGNNQLPACRRMIFLANTLNKIIVELDLKKMPNERQMIDDLYAMRRYPFVTFDRKAIEKKSDLVVLDVELTPDMKTADLKVKINDEVMNLGDYEVPAFVHIAMDPRFRVWERINRYAIDRQDVCVIDDNELTTFDNRTFAHELGKTWHVAMHTKTQKISSYKHEKDETISILVRDSSYIVARDVRKQIIKKDVNILIGNLVEGKFDTIKLRPAVKSEKKDKLVTPRMYINDEEVFPTIEHIVVLRDRDLDETVYVPTVRAWAKRYGAIALIVKEHNREMEILYDGERIHIRVNGWLRKNVRGICGTFTGEKYDLRTPANCIVRRERDFLATWAITDDKESQGPAMERAREAKQAKCFEHRIQYANVISEQEAGRKQVQRFGNDKYKFVEQMTYDSSSHELQEKESDRMCVTQRKVLYKYVEGKLCFSKRTLPVCPEGCKPEGSIERDVDAHCRDKDDAAVQIYRAKIDDGQSPNMHKYATNGLIRHTIPFKCVRA